jgi:hypothetical protein
MSAIVNLVRQAVGLSSADTADDRRSFQERAARATTAELKAMRAVNRSRNLAFNSADEEARAVAARLTAAAFAEAGDNGTELLALPVPEAKRAVERIMEPFTEEALTYGLVTLDFLPREYAARERILSSALSLKYAAEGVPADVVELRQTLRAAALALAAAEKELRDYGQSLGLVGQHGVESIEDRRRLESLRQKVEAAGREYGEARAGLWPDPDAA